MQNRRILGRSFLAMGLISAFLLSSIFSILPLSSKEQFYTQYAKTPIESNVKLLDNYSISGNGQDIPSFLLYNLTNNDPTTRDIHDPVSVDTDGNDIGFTNFTFNNIYAKNASYPLELTNNYYVVNSQQLMRNFTYVQQFFMPTDGYVNYIAAYLQASSIGYIVNMTIYNATYDPLLERYVPDQIIDPNYWVTADAANGPVFPQSLLAHWELFDFSSKRVVLHYNKTAHFGDLATFFVALDMPFSSTTCVWYAADDNFGFGVDSGEALLGTKFGGSGGGGDTGNPIFWQEIRDQNNNQTVDLSVVLEVAPVSNNPLPSQIGLRVDDRPVVDIQNAKGQFLSTDLKSPTGSSCVYNVTSAWTDFSFFSNQSVTFSLDQTYTVRQAINPDISYLVSTTQQNVLWNLSLSTNYPPDAIINSTNIEFQIPFNWNVTAVINTTGGGYDPWVPGSAFWYDGILRPSYNQTTIHNASTGTWLLNGLSQIYDFPGAINSTLAGQYYLANISDTLKLTGVVPAGPNGVPIFKRTDTDGHLTSLKPIMGSTLGSPNKIVTSDNSYLTLITQPTIAYSQGGIFDLNFSLTDTSGMLQNLLHEINVTIEQNTLNVSLDSKNADLISSDFNPAPVVPASTYSWDGVFQNVQINVLGPQYTDNIYFNFTANWLGNVARENITGFRATFVHNITDDFIPCTEILQAWNFSSHTWESLDVSGLTVGEVQYQGSENRWRYVTWDSALSTQINVTNYIGPANQIWCRWNSTAPKLYTGPNPYTEPVDYINLQYTFLNPVGPGNFTVSLYNQTSRAFDTPRAIPISSQDCETSFNFAQNVGDYYNVSTNNIQIRLNLTHWAPSAAIAFIDHLYVTFNYSQLVPLDWQQDILDVFETNIYTTQIETYQESLGNNITFSWDIDTTTLTPGNYSWLTLCNMGNQIAVNITDVWVAGLPTAINLRDGDGVQFNGTNWVTYPNPYVNDTSKSIRVRVNDTVYGVNLTTVTINTPTWPTGQLLVINEYATTGLDANRGYYTIYLNTTSLAASSLGYILTLTVTSPIYLTSMINVTVCVDPLPTTVGVIQSTFTVWENETFQIGASFEDTFHSKLITGADLTWQVVGGTPLQQGTFDQILYVYEANINTLESNIAPGTYTLTINATKLDFAASSNNITLIVLAKNRTVLTANYNQLSDNILEGTVIGVSATLNYQGNNSAIPNAEVEFVFTLFTGTGQEEVKKKGLTDTTGLASVDFLIPSGVTSIRVSANYAGTESIATSTANPSGTFVIITATQQLINTLMGYLPYIIVAIGAVIAISLYTRSQHKKMARFWDTRVSKLNDVLNIQHVLVIHKDSGTAILSQSMGTEKIDPNLISGFLTAMTSFQSEIAVKKKEGKEGKKGFLLDYADFKILLEDGEFIRAALILEAEASDTIKEDLVRFIQRYETRYHKELAAWKGNLNAVQGGENLIEEVFEISLIYPHVPNPSINTKKLPKLQKAIYEISKAITKERPFFFMSRLLEYAIAGRKEPKNEIWSVIYDMKKTHVLEPMTVATPSQ